MKKKSLYVNLHFNSEKNILLIEDSIPHFSRTHFNNIENHTYINSKK